SALLPACKKEATAPVSQQATAAQPGHSAAPTARPTDAKSALDLLMQGNERFVSGNFVTRDLSSAKRTELAGGQHPFAVVLTCSDSRVAPELLFDQSIGDIFVIRVAGNVTDKAGLGSIEYAAEHLNTPLILVLGHEKCGAVTAATKGDAAEGNIQFLVNEIKPAVQKAKTLGGDLVEKSVDENVRYVVSTMPARSEIINKLLKEGKVKLAGGTYSLSTGKVNIVSELGGSPAATPDRSSNEKSNQKEERIAKKAS